MAGAFAIPPPWPAPRQGLAAAWPALRDPQVASGMWLAMLAGLAFGVLDVLAPLRLSRLGAPVSVIGAAFLGAAAIEAALSPLAGKVSDSRGPLFPVRLALAAAVVVSLLAPLLAPAPVLVGLLVAGAPAYGALITPATSLLIGGALDRGLNQGMAFGLANLAWASGQAIAAAGSGALAQATYDFVPYALLAAACLATLSILRVVRHKLAERAAGQPPVPVLTPAGRY
jgi:MFS family permease